MLHYFLLLAYIIIICLLPIRNKRLSLVLCLIPLFLFVVFQNNWTPDYESYEDSYWEAHSNWLFSYFSLKFEYGFALLCALMPSYRMLIAFQMALFVIALFIVFYNYIPKKFWILCFIILWTDSNMLIMSLSAMRSCIVASIFIIAMHLRLNGYKVLPILLATPLFFFHNSALITLPFVLIGKNISKKVLYILFCLLFVYIIVNFINPGFLVQNVNSLLGDSEEMGRYTYYIDQYANGGAGNIIMKLLITLSLLFMMYMEIRMKRSNKDHVDFYFISTIFIFFLQGSGIPMVTRFTTYFGLFSLVCYTKMLQNDKSPMSRLFVLYVILINTYYLAFFVPRMGQWETLHYYHSILF